MHGAREVHHPKQAGLHRKAEAWSNCVVWQGTFQIGETIGNTNNGSSSFSDRRPSPQRHSGLQRSIKIRHLDLEHDSLKSFRSWEAFQIKFRGSWDKFYHPANHDDRSRENKCFSNYHSLPGPDAVHGHLSKLQWWARYANILSCLPRLWRNRRLNQTRFDPWLLWDSGVLHQHQHAA